MNVNLSQTRNFIDPDVPWPIPALNINATDVEESGRSTHARPRRWSADGRRERVLRVQPSWSVVIVKTTLNYAGKPERIMRERCQGSRAAPVLRLTVSDRVEYVVCRRDEVPARTWTDPSLVVERYITNPDGLFIRAYIVGPAAVVTLAWAASDIKKLSLPQSDRRDYYFWDTTRDRPDVRGRGPARFATARPLASALGRRLLRHRLRGRRRWHDHPGRCQQDALLGPPSTVPSLSAPASRLQHADRRFHVGHRAAPWYQVSHPVTPSPRFRQCASALCATNNSATSCA